MLRRSMNQKHVSALVGASGLLAASLLFSVACRSTAADPALRQEVQAYLDGYNARYRELVTASSEAQWLAQTHIVEGDDSNDARVQAADEALTAFTGSTANIDAARKYLARSDALDELQVRQLRAVLFKAGGSPQTVADVVKRRIAAETAQTKKLYGFEFTLDGQPLSPNDIDDGLRKEHDLAQR